MNDIDLSQGLFINDYNTIVRWQISRKEFVLQIPTAEHSIVDFNNINGYSIQSKLFELPYSFRLTFVFKNENLQSINIGSEQFIDFDTLSSELENIFGSPKVQKRLFSNKGEKKHVWKFDGCRLELFTEFYDGDLRHGLRIIIT